MENIDGNPVTLVVANKDLEDGAPVKCPHTLGAFLYLKANNIQLKITEPKDLSEEGSAPFFRFGAQEYFEKDRDLNETTPLIGVSSYWKFDERRFSTKRGAEKKDVDMYTKRVSQFLVPLREFVFSTYIENRSHDGESEHANNLITQLYDVLGERSSFLEMDTTFTSELDVCFATIAIIIVRKMDQSPIWRKLRRHTALFSYAHRFMSIYMNVMADPLDLSKVLVGEVAKNFKEVLRCHGERIRNHSVYCCNFSPNNLYGLPHGNFIVKTFTSLDSKPDTKVTEPSTKVTEPNMNFSRML